MVQQARQTADSVMSRYPDTSIVCLFEAKVMAQDKLLEDDAA
jgi:hypothetical protein